MKRIILLTILMGMFSSVYAMTYFLTADYYESGNHMCKYGNGTVLNVGASICPLSIQG